MWSIFPGPDDLRLRKCDLNQRADLLKASEEEASFPLKEHCSLQSAGGPEAVFFCIYTVYIFGVYIF